MNSHIVLTITPISSLNAVLNWLWTDLGLKSNSARIVNNSGTWLEIRDVSLEGDVDADDYEPVLWVQLSRREVSENEELCLNSVLVVQVWTSDPTPVVCQLSNGARSITTPSPWQEIAIVATEKGITARDVSFVETKWGENAIWPFN